jgi:hypothetical protein
MNPSAGSGMCPVDLGYADSEPVSLDVGAVMTRGMRVRRRRLLTRVAAATMAVAAVPAAGLIAFLAVGSHIAGPEGTPALRPPAVGSPAAAGGGSARHSASHNGGSHSGGPVRRGPVFGYVAAPDDGPLAGRAVPTRVGASVTLHGRYGPVTTLAGDQGGDGVWFWDENATEVTIFHLSSDGHLRSWPAAALTPSLTSGTAAGFAVSAGGVAWLGLRSTLIELDTVTGHVRRWQIPAPRANPAARRFQPPGLRTSHLVQSLAVRTSGEIAVCDTNASSVQVLDLASGRWRQVMLPSRDDEPVAVGFAPDGTLGIGYQHAGSPHRSAVLLDPVSGPVISRTVIESRGITAQGTGFIVGVSRPELVSAAGLVRPLARPAVMLGSIGDAVPLARLPGGRIASIVSGSILAFPASAASDRKAAVAAVRYVPPRDLIIGFVAADARGHLWVLPGSGQPAVDELVPG